MYKSRAEKKIIFRIITLRTLVLSVCLVLFLSACLVGVADGDVAEVFLLAKSRKIPIYGVKTEEKVASFTFDAAYGSDKTEKILEILDEYGIKATFYLVGFWVDKYPELTKKISDCGHEIGTHSNMHEHMSKMSTTDIKADLSVSVKKIEEIIGKRVDLFRAPYGEYNDTVVNCAEELGLFTIQWSVDSLDWKGLSAQEMTSRVISRIHEGAIMLYHNNSDHIVEALPTIIELMKTQGYTFRTVGELIYRENYKIDNNGMQIKIA